MCGCKENIEKESPCKCQENNYENGGSIDSERRFSESDYNRLIESTLFKGRWTGFVWEIYPSEGGNILGKFNPKTKTLFIAGKKDKSNPLVEWLQNNSHVSMEEYQKLKNGGIPSKNWDKYEDGGAVVGGFSLVYQKWSDIMGGNGVSGTIRTTPANYYVATIDENGEIIFDYIEAMTRDIDVAKVRNLWENNLIPEEKKRYDDGGNVDSFKIIKDDFKVMPSEPNRVYHTIEGTYGDYWFVAKTDNSHKFGYGSDGINKGCVYKLDLWLGGNPVGREQSTKGGHVSEDYVASYFNKWDYKPSTHKHKMAVVKIVDFLEKNICDLKREYTSVKFKKGGDVPVKVYEVKYYGKSHLAKKGKLRGNYSTYIKASSREEAIRLAKKDDSDFAELIHSKPTKLNPEFMENGGMTGKEKRYSVYELKFGQPYNFYNEEQNRFIFSDASKATLYTEEEAEMVRKKLLETRIELYQITGKNYKEIHIGDLYKKRILKYSNGGVIGNYEIEIIENSERKKRWKGVVSKSTYNKIESLKNSGGFLRYDIDLYDDNSSEKADNSGLYEFMNDIGIKWTSTLPTVDPKRVYRLENGGISSNEISKQQLESMVGRSLNGWNDDVVYYNGEKYKKCFLRPYYKKK